VNLPGPRDVYEEKDDVFFIGGDQVENHVEIKTPKPNYDQGRASKRRILRVTASRVAAGLDRSQVHAFVGFPYNPNGFFGDYNWPVTKYFLSASDYLIGRSFWNHVGASDTTYDDLLDCYMEVARARKAELLALLTEV
jgi:hypothetical protein